MSDRPLDSRFKVFLQSFVFKKMTQGMGPSWRPAVARVKLDKCR